MIQLCGSGLGQAGSSTKLGAVVPLGGAGIASTRRSKDLRLLQGVDTACRPLRGQRRAEPRETNRGGEDSHDAKVLGNHQRAPVAPLQSRAAGCCPCTSSLAPLRVALTLDPPAAVPAARGRQVYTFLSVLRYSGYSVWANPHARFLRDVVGAHHAVFILFCPGRSCGTRPVSSSDGVSLPVLHVPRLMASCPRRDQIPRRDSPCEARDSSDPPGPSRSSAGCRAAQPSPELRAIAARIPTPRDIHALLTCVVRHQRVAVPMPGRESRRRATFPPTSTTPRVSRQPGRPCGQSRRP